MSILSTRPSSSKVRASHSLSAPEPTAVRRVASLTIVCLVKKLNDVREDDVIYNNRLDTLLADVFNLLSLFFLTIGKTKEAPATYSQLASMRVGMKSLHSFLPFFTVRIHTGLAESPITTLPLTRSHLGLGRDLAAPWPFQRDLTISTVLGVKCNVMLVSDALMILPPAGPPMCALYARPYFSPSAVAVGTMPRTSKRPIHTI